MLEVNKISLYGWEKIDNNNPIIRGILYVRVGIRTFDNINRLITLSVITLSGIHCSTSKCVMSGGAHLHGLVPGQRSLEGTSQQWRAAGDSKPI